MKRLTPDSPELKSADLVAENIERLRELFPEAFANEGKIDFDVLRQLLGDRVDDGEERYGLNWHGKRAARQLALTPSTGTLRPCPEESVDWNTTRNVFIEGDNLEVLKLLQKSYAGKVKLIYIDPPYNTGKDFVYPDNFQDSIKNYLEITGQVEGGQRITSNTEASGRFHTDWLNMMYPRLKLARRLLRPDGVIFISIDDAEVARLRELCDDLFGESNFVAELVWEGANKNDARQIGISHEYVLVYAANRDALPREWKQAKEGVDEVLAEVDRLRKQHGSDYGSASRDLAGWFRSMKASPVFGLRRFNKLDARGAYKEDDPTAPGGRKFDLVNPNTGEVIPLRRNRGWGFDQTEFERLVGESRITFVSPTSIMVRRYLHETDTATPQSVFYQPARSASERLAKLLGPNVFDFPKDEYVLGRFIEMATSKDDEGAIVLDFFAGSGTSGHATVLQNAADGGSRRFILVQLPEPLSADIPEQRAAAHFCESLERPATVSEITAERLRRAGKSVQAASPGFAGDVGLRVFRLADGNVRPWEASRETLAESLAAAVDHVKADRTEADLLYDIILKHSLDLCEPIEEKQIGSHKVCSVGGGVVFACFGSRITAADVEQLADGIAKWRDELAPANPELSRVVFRDSAFETDVAKTNLALILKERGFDEKLVVSL